MFFTRVCAQRVVRQFCNLGASTGAPPFPPSAGVMRKHEVIDGHESEGVTRILFCGPYFAASHIYTREYVSQFPYIQVDDVPLDDVPDVIGNYHLCVVKNMQLKSDVIAQAQKMKIIMQFGVGLEGVDINAATRCGVKVARIPGHNTGNAASCAELSIYLMLGLLRCQTEMQNSIRLKRLGEPAGETLFGKTVFIMGFGSIGVELAKRLRPFGVRILATKRRWTSCGINGASSQSDSIDAFVDEKGSHDDAYKFASIAHITVICLSLNHETAGIVNKSFLSAMKKGACLINIARGGLLDYHAVYDSLQSGHLGGLGIDVAWTEPFNPDDPILKFPNVLITPHVGGVTESSYRSMAKVVGDVALQLHAGTAIKGIEFVN